MTKKEKAVIDKIIDKIITSGALVKGTDYNFSSAVITRSSVITRNLIGVLVDEPIEETITEIRIGNLFSEGSKIRGVIISMQTEFLLLKLVRGLMVIGNTLSHQNMVLIFLRSLLRDFTITLKRTNT